MTVSSTSSRAVYAGNGSTTAFPFAFKVNAASDLVVTWTDAAGTEVALTSGQYAATGFGQDAGGTVTYPLTGDPIAAGTSLTLQRVVSPTQPTTISNQGPASTAPAVSGLFTKRNRRPSAVPPARFLSMKTWLTMTALPPTRASATPKARPASSGMP